MYEGERFAPADQVGTTGTNNRPAFSGPLKFLSAERDRLASLRWTAFDAAQVGPTIGAEISGVDLAAHLADDVVDQLREALYAYKVLFLRDQQLTPAQQVAFARRFGDLEIHPFAPSDADQPELVRLEKSETAMGYENIWHHDVTWRECPSMIALLRAIDVPPVGGDTLFADMHAAYEGLDADTRERIDNLWAVHDYLPTFGRVMPSEKVFEMRAQFPPVRHPVVCRHPATGRPHLYVNRAFTSHIEGLWSEESTELLEHLFRQADRPEYQCRLRWEPNTVALWDNRAVQHYAASDYWPSVRIMERASVIGSRPAA
jgi:taurine dioxygenase